MNELHKTASFPTRATLQSRGMMATKLCGNVLNPIKNICHKRASPVCRVNLYVLTAPTTMLFSLYFQFLFLYVVYLLKSEHLRKRLAANTVMRTTKQI